MTPTSRLPLKLFSVQFFLQVREFPRAVSAMHANCPFPKERMELAESVYEEETGRISGCNQPHPELFIRFGESDAEIWRTDGTGAGTYEVADVGQPGPLAAVAGKRLIFAAASTPGNFEPWASDGTPEGTRQLKEVRGGKRGSLPESFTSLGPSQVLFTAFNGRGVEPWITAVTFAP